MLDLSQEAILQFFNSLAYDPVAVYSALIGLMVASSFGLPVPEEATLISVGMVAYFTRYPELYPPPEPGMTPINPHTLAAVAFVAVFLCDILVYSIGRFGGRQVLRIPLVQRFVTPAAVERIERWSQKYGIFAAGIFRFTPGLRFPGHLMCGVSRLSLPKFMAVDGLAAMISVPAQVLLIAYYGDKILATFKQVQFSLLGVILVILTALFIRRYLRNIGKLGARRS